MTDRLFTGQVYDGDTSAGGTGLYYYNARMYDPALGRFTQADTIVPEPSRPLAFDRYAYVYNNPVRYTDPSGHCLPEECPDYHSGVYDEAIGLLEFVPHGLRAWDTTWLTDLISWLKFGVKFDNGIDKWTASAIREVVVALNRVEKAFQIWGVDTRSALGSSIVFEKANSVGVGGRHWPNRIRYYAPASGGGAIGIEVLIHEIGHQVDWQLGGGAGYWSNGSEWKGEFWIYLPSGWTALEPISSYATSPREDFAETFTYAVERANGEYPSDRRKRSYDEDRITTMINALTTAFGK